PRRAHRSIESYLALPLRNDHAERVCDVRRRYDEDDARAAREESHHACDEDADVAGAGVLGLELHGGAGVDDAARGSAARDLHHGARVASPRAIACVLLVPAADDLERERDAEVDRAPRDADEADADRSR